LYLCRFSFNTFHLILNSLGIKEEIIIKPEIILNPEIIDISTVLLLLAASGLSWLLPYI
jgi:hypothetical protein